MRKGIGKKKKKKKKKGNRVRTVGAVPKMMAEMLCRIISTCYSIAAILTIQCRPVVAPSIEDGEWDCWPEIEFGG